MRRALRKINRAILGNLPLKIASLILGFLLWTTLLIMPEVKVSYTVPLEIRNIPQNLELVYQSTNNVTINIKGRQVQLSTISPDTIEDVYIDLTKISDPGTYTMFISKEKIKLPQGVEIVSIFPRAVEVTLEAIVSKVVPTKPIIKGKPAEGFILGDVKPLIEEIKIFGPQSVLKDVDKLPTDPIDISGYANSFIINASLKPPNEYVHLGEVRQVIVEVSIEEMRIERILSPVVISTEPGIKTEPSTVSITIEGPKSAVDRLNALDFKVILYTDDLEPGVYELEPHIEGIPPNINVKSLEPPFIKVTIMQPTPSQVKGLIHPTDEVVEKEDVQ